jgi:choline dehydrogenase-like flavoprotein
MGTCSMMREGLGGVVDSRLRVYGTANVRVCDAGVVPVVPRGNVLAAVYGFAEKLAEIIVREVEGCL